MAERFRSTTAPVIQEIDTVRRSDTAISFDSSDRALIMVQTAAIAVTCSGCGNDMHYVGKLPAIGLHSVVHVFKCRTCLTICSKGADTAPAKKMVSA
jgi:hypothetical protein